jgi:hypothetical protein
MGRIMGAALRTMEREAEVVAEEARREWYGPNGVTRETGKSGDIQVVTTVDLNRSEVVVSLGSTDDRRVVATRKRSRTGDTVQVGKPVVVYVHQPWGTSLQPKEVSRDEWFAWRRKGAPALPPPPGTLGPGKARDGAVKFWSDKQATKGLKEGRWYILIAGVDAGDTAKRSQSFLLQRLVKNPGKALAKRIGPEIAREIAQAVNRG